MRGNWRIYSVDSKWNYEMQCYEHTQVQCAACRKTIQLPEMVEGYMQPSDWLQVPCVAEHMATHKVVTCEHCKCLVRKSNLKRHQAGLECQTRKFANSLDTAGLERASTYHLQMIDGYFEDKVNALIYGAEPLPGWSRRRNTVNLRHTTALSHREQCEIKYEAERLKAELLDSLGVQRHKTCYVASGWGGSARVETHPWIRKDANQLLELLLKNRGFTEEVYDQLLRYHSNPNERDAIVLFAELRNEQEN